MQNLYFQILNKCLSSSDLRQQLIKTQSNLPSDSLLQIKVVALISLDQWVRCSKMAPNSNSLILGAIILNQTKEVLNNSGQFHSIIIKIMSHLERIIQQQETILLFDRRLEELVLMLFNLVHLEQQVYNSDH